mmetsp:Transcript_14980/g.12722  ORF Transcript_14980/g.12722 Transcript_14980/m.12722 type:complete len:116 (+) Transcript_14980:381-728(+)
MAEISDPSRARTLGVITKVDLEDEGSNIVLNYLNNENLILNYGYIAVKNRSQKDIDASVDVREGLLKEQEYFNQHPKYKDLNNKVGTKVLSNHLSIVLFEHIRNTLPSIENSINK